MGSTYRRVLRLAHGLGVVALSYTEKSERDSFVFAELKLDDLRDLSSSVTRCRSLLDLDADPMAVVEALGSDHLIGEFVRSQPGLRVPGHVDSEELAVRAVLGQQVSVAAARRLTAQLVMTYGEPLAMPSGTLTHAFPSSGRLARLTSLEIGMPEKRRNTVVGLARALAEGRVDLSAGADRDEAAVALQQLPGIGPWTSSYIRMRGLGDPDAFLESDLGVRRALVGLGVAGDPKSAFAHAERWRPWRSYALIHLWSTHQTPTVKKYSKVC
jgi:AraC family transcriptional regulator of adaptative response / DNA-3-methyladenine glycosylase II